MLTNLPTKTICIIALFAFAVCAWTGILFDSQPPLQPPHNSQTVSQPTDCAAQECPPISSKEVNDARLADYTEMLAWFTGVLAVVALIQIFFLIRADIATRTALVASNRPWVFTQPWPATAQVLMNEEIHFEMEFHCYGNAPATVIELCVEPDNRWWEKDVDGTFFKTTWQRPYVFGFIRYQDQFGIHTSGYCTRLLPYDRKDPKDRWVAIATAGTPAWSRFD
jgi:hypothetical protein